MTTAKGRILATARSRARWRRESPLVVFYALATLLIIGFIGFMVAQTTFGLDLWLPGLFGSLSHGTTESHRTHDIVFALLIATAAIGVLAQLRRPAQHGAAMVMALVPLAAILLAGVLSDGYEIMVRRNPTRLIGPMVLVTALVHPAGRSFLRSFRAPGVSATMLALAGAAAAPLLVLASDKLTLQGTVRDEHYALGHYGFMAAFAFTVVGIAVLASLRPDGWRLTAWVAGSLALLLGITSVAYQGSASSLGSSWALAAIGWGILFVVVAEGTRASAGTTARRERSRRRPVVADV